MRLSAWLGIMVSVMAFLIAGCGPPALDPEIKKLGNDYVNKAPRYLQEKDDDKKVALKRDLDALEVKIAAITGGQKRAFDEQFAHLPRIKKESGRRVQVKHGMVGLWPMIRPRSRGWHDELRNARTRRPGHRRRRGRPAAAIEASAAGVSVGLVCKSLLGKAHTVMAEGGIAAALANVDARDNWKVHFADTMRGGQYVNNWRMAQLHAQEAPDRVRELEAWGAVFDRTKDGRILQRNFGGHKFPRLAHVGDRTGLEMIRTLQDHGIHQGMSVYMECTIIRLLKDGDRISGAFGYYRENGRFVLFKAKAVVLATGGIGKAYKITSNSWEYTGDGHSLAYYAGAELIDMEFIQFHPTGMVWPPSVRGILVTEGVRGEGGCCATARANASCSATSPTITSTQTADNEEEGFLYVLGEKYQGKDARRPPELLTRDHVARCIVREVKQGRGSPHGGVFLELDSFAKWMQEARQLQRRRALEEKAAQHVSPVQGTGQRRHHQAADGSRADHPLCHGRRARRRRHADVARFPACSPAASVRPASTAPIGWAAIRCPTCSCWANAPANMRPSLLRNKAHGQVADGSGGGSGPLGLELHRRPGRR